jgi:hypothetical protein
MFVGDLDKQGWKEQDLGLFDRLMPTHPTVIVEHYSGYLEGVDSALHQIKNRSFLQRLFD